LVVACVLAAPLLAGIALASGRSWAGFLHKILVEFQTQASLVNSVSLRAALLTFGVPPRTPLIPVLQACALAMLVAWFASGGAVAEARAANGRRRRIAAPGGDARRDVAHANHRAARVERRGADGGRRLRGRGGRRSCLGAARSPRRHGPHESRDRARVAGRDG